MSESDYWVQWHRQYEDPSSARSRRLRSVQEQLRAALSSAPAGPLRLISMCAGEGRDVVTVLADHPRGADVRALLVEKSPELAERARQAIARAGLATIDMLEGDAALTSAYEALVPADVVLLCGVFGSLEEPDIEATVRELPHLCSAGATVIWTKEGNPPDIREWVRSVFTEAGFEEVEYHTEEGAVFGVGSARWNRPPQTFRPDRRMFSFRVRTLPAASS